MYFKFSTNSCGAKKLNYYVRTTNGKVLLFL